VLDPLESLKLETPGPARAQPRTSTAIRSSRRATSKKGSRSRITSSKAPTARRWSNTCRSSRTRPSRTGIRTGRVTIYSTLGRITLGRADVARTLGHPDEPRPHRRHRGRRQLRRQERDHDRAGDGAALEEDGPPGQVRVHAP
jgi:hypothetical protein